MPEEMRTAPVAFPGFRKSVGFDAAVAALAFLLRSAVASGCRQEVVEGQVVTVVDGEVELLVAEVPQLVEAL